MEQPSTYALTVRFIALTNITSLHRTPKKKKNNKQATLDVVLI